jgi:hypothetical protein
MFLLIFIDKIISSTTDDGLSKSQKDLNII